MVKQFRDHLLLYLSHININFTAKLKQNRLLLRRPKLLRVFTYMLITQTSINHITFKILQLIFEILNYTMRRRDFARETRGAYKGFFVGKYLRDETRGRHRCRQKHNVKIDHRQIGWWVWAGFMWLRKRASGGLF